MGPSLWSRSPILGSSDTSRIPTVESISKFFSLHASVVEEESVATIKDHVMHQHKMSSAGVVAIVASWFILHCLATFLNNDLLGHSAHLVPPLTMTLGMIDNS